MMRERSAQRWFGRGWESVDSGGVLRWVAMVAVCLAVGSSKADGQGSESPQALLAKLQASHYTMAKTADGATILVTSDESIHAGYFGLGLKKSLFVSKGLVKLPLDQQAALVGYAMGTLQLVGAKESEQTDAASLDKVVVQMGIGKESVKALLKTVQDAMLAAATPTGHVDVTPAPPSNSVQQSETHFAEVIDDDTTHEDSSEDTAKFVQAIGSRDVATLKGLAAKYPAGAADIRVIVAAMGDHSMKNPNHGVVFGSTDALKAGNKLMAGDHAPPDSTPADLISDYAARIAALGN